VNTVLRLAEYQLRDLVRSRWILIYVGFLFVSTDLLLRFSVSQTSALLSMGSAVILLVPLATLLFGALYMYAARSFHELLLAQPVSRHQLFAGTYIGIALPLTAAFGIGVALPLVYHVPHDPGALRAAVVVIGSGGALTLVCTGIALLVAAAVEDRMKGVAAAMGIWLLLAVLYDSGVLLLVALLADYPLERPLAVLMLINPIDLARVLLLVEMDAAALMNYTGAVLTRLLGEATGRGVGVAALAAWITIPPVLAWRVFARRDM
jgi:Cu-processing system permease protein